MKIMLVSPEQEYFLVLESLLKERVCAGISNIHYTHPLKAIDNIDEIDPDLLVWDVDGFPRHWKILISLYRQLKEKKLLRVILISEKELNKEEQKKSKELGIRDFIQRYEYSEVIVSIILQYESASITSQTNFVNIQSTYFPTEDDKIALVFSDPKSYGIIHGQVSALHPQHVEFSSHSQIAQLSNTTIFKNSHINIKDSIIKINISLEQNKDLYKAHILPPRSEYEQIFYNLNKDSLH